MTSAQIRAEFLAALRQFDRIGEDGGGLTRLAGSREDAAARREFEKGVRSVGLHYCTDAIGNQFGLRRGPDGSPLVLVGSHLDSQPSGGRFDGQVGVVTGLFAVAEHVKETAADDSGVNVGVVNWTNEEGARFQPSVMGSSVFTGSLAVDAALAATDVHGVVLGDELRAGRFLGEADVRTDVSAYAEIHVEQGACLEAERMDIGVVTGNWAAAKYTVAISGLQTHTGPTPMAERKDALYAASLMIAAVHERGLADEEGNLHTAVAWLNVEPNSPNATPTRVRAKVELRTDDPRKAEATALWFETCVADIAARTGTTIELEERSVRPPRSMWADGVELAEVAARSAGLSSMRMQTVAGHDAVVMNGHVPTVLAFLPSAGGYTHNRHEYTSDDDLFNGLALMIEVLGRLAARLARRSALSSRAES